MKARVGIVGYRGYSGAELVRILAHHPHVEAVLLEHREDAAGANAVRRPQGPPRFPYDPELIQKEGLMLIFLATPPEVSMELAPALLAAGARVVDLSGAFRLRTPGNYAAWYHAPHTQPALLAEAVYGLPEFCRERIPAVLSDRRQPGAPAAARSRRRGPLGGHRLRRQERRQRRGTQAQPQDQLLRGHRKLLGLLGAPPPPRAGGVAGLWPRRARIQLHRPTPAT
jgi:hypothetical protein